MQAAIKDEKWNSVFIINAHDNANNSEPMAGNFEFYGDSFVWNWQLRINLIADEVCNKTKFKTPSFSDSVSKGLILLTPDPIFQNNNHKVFQDQTWLPGSRATFTLWTSRRVIKLPFFALNITRLDEECHCHCIVAKIGDVNWRRLQFTGSTSLCLPPFPWRKKLPSHHSKKITIRSLPKKISIRSLPKSDNLSPLCRKHSTSPASFPATVIFSQSRITFLLSRTSPPVSTGFRCPRYCPTL